MNAKVVHLVHTLLLALGLRQAPPPQLVVVRCLPPAKRSARRR